MQIKNQYQWHEVVMAEVQRGVNRGGVISGAECADSSQCKMSFVTMETPAGDDKCTENLHPIGSPNPVHSFPAGRGPF